MLKADITEILKNGLGVAYRGENHLGYDVFAR